MSALTVYTYVNCDTCRRAVKWLKGQGVTFVEKPIRETPPSLAELRKVLAAQGGEIRKLFNTSGKDYRDQKLGETLPMLDESRALGLLTKNGFLVKRPFVVGPDVGLVGFDEEKWTTALKSQ